MWYFLCAIKSVFDLKRVCRSCGKSQLVPMKDKGKPVVCKQCGSKIPPPKDKC